MIIGLGTDIVQISRFTDHSESHLGRLAKRILADSEWPAWQLLSMHPRQQMARFLAKRFAAKEAAAKALGTGIAKGVRLDELAVGHDALGKPLLLLSGAARERARQLGVEFCHLSIADERDYACATVILEGR